MYEVIGSKSIIKSRCDRVTEDDFDEINKFFGSFRDCPFPIEESPFFQFSLIWMITSKSDEEYEKRGLHIGREKEDVEERFDVRDQFMNPWRTYCKANSEREEILFKTTLSRGEQ